MDDEDDISELERLIFGDIPIGDAEAISDTVLDYDVMIRFGDPELDGSLSRAAKSMDFCDSDPITGASCACSHSRLKSFAIGLGEPGEEDRILSIATLGIEAHRDGRMQVGIRTIFTDRQFRGEGLANILAGAARIIIERAAENWTDLPGSLGSDLIEIEVVGQGLSEGGESFICKVAEHAARVIEMTECGLLEEPDFAV